MVNESEQLVQLRNPAGQGGEWTGDWSDSSDQWTNQLKEDLEVKDEDDGIFYMPYQSFKELFLRVGVCMYVEGFVSKGIEIVKGESAWKVTIPEDCNEIFFVVSQMNS